MAASQEADQFMLHAVPVPGDGNCLFYSVALVLLDWLDRSCPASPDATSAKAVWKGLGVGVPPSAAKEERVTPSAAKGSKGAPSESHGAANTCETGSSAAIPSPSSEDVCDVARYLRSLVASRVLDRTDEESERMIDTWRRLWGDAWKEYREQKDQKPGAAPPILLELQHLDESISPADAGPLPLPQRRALYRNMMEPRRYWGDEFALRTLETALNGRFCVVDERLNVIKRESNETSRVSTLCRIPGDILPEDRGPFLGVLLLRHGHYEPAASDDGQMAWDLRDLPLQLQRVLNYLQNHP
jgi:hypothetical protein